MKSINIAPFALPNCEPGELYFEEPRDITDVIVLSSRPVERSIYYRTNAWPVGMWYEDNFDIDNPARFGWMAIDDHFNGEWKTAEVVANASEGATRYSFKTLAHEAWKNIVTNSESKSAIDRGDTLFRRTVSIKVSPWNEGDELQVFTTSPTETLSVYVELRGNPEFGSTFSVSSYNCTIKAIDAIAGAVVDDGRITITGDTALAASPGSVRIDLETMIPAHRYSGDTGLISFEFEDEIVTISTLDLIRSPGVWYEEAGLFCTQVKPHVTTFEQYIEMFRDSEPPWKYAVYGDHGENAPAKSRRKEQSFGGARNGQPRPHPVHAHVGVKHARQRFLLEPNGDVVLDRNCLWKVEGGLDADKVFPNETNGRFFYGLEQWISRGRFRDPSKAPIFYMESQQKSIVVRQTTIAAPATRLFSESQETSDEPVFALVRFEFEDFGTEVCPAELTLSYSSKSNRSHNALSYSEDQTDHLVPKSEREQLLASDGEIRGTWKDKQIVRAIYDTQMTVGTTSASVDAGSTDIRFSASLEPREQCALLLKIPFIPGQQDDLIERIVSKTFEQVKNEAIGFWRNQFSRGAHIKTPVPHINSLHETHLSHVQISDFTMPGNQNLINTSVGTSVYGNFSNESCMIVQELIQRGFLDEAKGRLDLWIAYQGTVEQPGNFTDYRGMYYGAGGFEQGNYNQHHGWVLWCMAEYYLLTGDLAWFKNVTSSVVDACDWVFRQREGTIKNLPHSRGWEHGFLPAGSLEDVEEFHYWLSTNALTWRATHHAALALERIGHPEASRIRSESDSFAADLRTGLETARKYSPLVAKSDGTWIPSFPSRLYCRGRDFGWIREVLEGSIYLLISGLYDCRSKAAGWIVDDFQENRYLNPPFGYHLRDQRLLARYRGGFSIQPTLLAGLIPHLERDEAEIYIWMLFNSIAACYREEIEGFSEHPMPELGFSNDAQFKTSDEANAVMWIRYLFAYWNYDELHIGRAMPREWLSGGNVEGVEVQGLHTYHGEIDVRYVCNPDENTMSLYLNRTGEMTSSRVTARFRHPQKRRIESVRINGETWMQFDADTEDVELTGLSGPLTVEATFV